MAGGFDSGYDDGYDSASVTTGGGWDFLLGILRANREEQAAERAIPPVACPIHGEPLEAARGVLHCAVGHLVDADRTIY